MADFETKDSGAREEFDSGMHRDTQAGKARFDLIIPKGVPYSDQLLTRFAELLGRGAEKYTERNWEQANSQAEIERAKASAIRHFMQWFCGERDEDHAAAVMFNLMVVETTESKLKAEADLEDNEVETGPLGPEWEDVGYMVEDVRTVVADCFASVFDKVFAPQVEVPPAFVKFPETDIRPIIDKVNQDIANLAAVTETFSFPPPKEPVKVEWRDPEPITIELKGVSHETMRLFFGGPILTRFEVAGDGETTDLIPPVDREPYAWAPVDTSVVDAFVAETPATEAGDPEHWTDGVVYPTPLLESIYGPEVKRQREADRFFLDAFVTGDPKRWVEDYDHERPPSRWERG